jgi:hypothetical protein
MQHFPPPHVRPGCSPGLFVVLMWAIPTMLVLEGLFFWWVFA